MKYKVLISEKNDLTLTEQYIPKTVVGTDLCFDDAVDLKAKYIKEGYSVTMVEDTVGR